MAQYSIHRNSNCHSIAMPAKFFNTLLIFVKLSNSNCHRIALLVQFFHTLVTLGITIIGTFNSQMKLPLHSFASKILPNISYTRYHFHRHMLQSNSNCTPIALLAQLSHTFITLGITIIGTCNCPTVIAIA